MLANSERTAITRRGGTAAVSAPLRWLDDHNFINGPVLDWGCGKGQDVVWLRNSYGYDPCYQPTLPPAGEVYNTVLCTYVLNTIPDYFARAEIIAEALEYLASGGWLYVTIRSEKAIDRMGGGGTTQKGTWQGYVGGQLFYGDFTLIRKVADYEIWGWQHP